MKSPLNSFCSRLFASGILIAVLSANAQDAPNAGKKTLSVETIKPVGAVADKIGKAGKANSLDQLVQSLDGQLTDRLNATHKFDLLASSDLKDILKVQDRADSGNFDANDKAAEQFKLAKSQFVLITTLDDFRDYSETIQFEGIGQSGTMRVFQLSAIGKIYDTKTGKLLNSASFEISNTNKTINDSDTTRNGDLSDELVAAISRDMAGKIARHVVGVLCPPTVVDVTGTQVTIDWGSGMPIAKDDEWEVCVQKMKKGIPVMVTVGKVKITRVDEMSATGEIVGENNGIAEDCVMRKP